MNCTLYINLNEDEISKEKSYNFVEDLLLNIFNNSSFNISESFDYNIN